MTARWRPMRRADLDAVAAVAEMVHPDYPERPEVFAERLSLFPAGCFIAEGEAGVLGYAISHPGIIGAPPALDSLLGALPDQPDCLYLHDVALLPKARGLGLGRALLARLQALGLHTIALTAVNGSGPFWRGLGFGDSPCAKLASYGDDAAYLTLTCADAVS